MKNIRLCIQTKRLVQHPITVLCIVFFTVPIRLIAAAGQTLSIRKCHAKSKLFCLCRLNIKERDGIALNLSGFSVRNSNQMHTVTDVFGLLFAQKHMCNLVYLLYHLCMAVNPRLSVIDTLLHILTDNTNHPDDAHKVIDVLVCQKQIVNGVDINPRPLELTQNGISAARIYHKVLFSFAEHKAGIITFRHQRIAGSQQGQFHMLVLLVIISSVLYGKKRVL